MASPSEDLRDQTRQQILNSMGGWSGTIAAAIPLLVFVIANALAGLRTAIIAAVAAGVLVAGYRMARRQPVQQAMTGLFSVAIAAAIAARTGEARGFFLLGIAAAFVYAGVFALSLLVRRPLVGVIWEYLDPSPLPPGARWHRVRELRRAYDIATAAVLAMFTARAVVQLSLFQENRTGLLAVAKLVMGLPLFLVVVAVVFWVVRRGRSRLGLPPPTLEPPGLTAQQTTGQPQAQQTTGQPQAQPAPGQPQAQPAPGQPLAQQASAPQQASGSGDADSPSDGGLSLRKGDE